MPFLAPRPLPTITATGVASPRAHGQDMTSTDIPRARAKLALCPAMSHPAMTTSAIPITAGTNTPDTLSAILAIGAFVAAAPSTIFIILLSAVSSPTLSARHLRYPEVFIVAALTAEPGALSTGTDSPVSADSFTALSPSSTTPSTGMLSPGRTTNTSPTRTSSMSASTSSPPRSSLARLGASFIRLFSAFVVRPFESDSSVLPTVIRAGIMAADSKYSSLW